MPKNKSQRRLDAINGNGHGRRYASLTVAAEYVGCHRETIRKMQADGRLTKYQLGPRVLRVDLNEIDAAMAAGVAS